MKSRPLLFEDLVPGAELGRHVATWDEETSRYWKSIFPDDVNAGAEGAGMAVALMMRSYLAVTPRPPGNVHARQRLHLVSPPVKGETVHTVVSCAGKQIKRERRYVDIGISATGADERLLYQGTLTLVWAA
jgi:hypothetical protein